MTTRPASARAPWARGGLYGLVAALSPLVWVFEVSTCGGSAPRQGEYTGAWLFARIDAEGWAVLVPVLAIAVAAPFVAARLRAGWATLVHLLALAAVGFATWLMGFLLTFSLFAERSLRGAGWLVALATVGTVVDALARLALAAGEWLSERRAQAAERDRGAAG